MRAGKAGAQVAWSSDEPVLPINNPIKPEWITKGDHSGGYAVPFWCVVALISVVAALVKASIAP